MSTNTQVTILLDASASMDSLTASVRDAFEYLVSEFTLNDPPVAFSTLVFPAITECGATVEQIFSAEEYNAYGGNTPLNTAVAKVIKGLSADKRHILIIQTDGTPTDTFREGSDNLTICKQTVSNFLAANNVIIYLIDDNTSTWHSDVGIANEFVFHIKNKKALKSVLQKVTNNVTAFLASPTSDIRLLTDGRHNF